MAKNKAPATKKVKDSMVIISIATAIGLLFPLLQREWNDIGRMINGLIIGIVGGGFIALNEIWYNRVVVRQMKFRTLLIYKSLVYSIFFVLFIILEISIQRAITNGMNIFEYFRSAKFYDFICNEDFYIMIIYALAGTTTFIFVYQISRKMGQGVLWNFISGKYHQAREEDRIFMFMDINESTALAENLGDIEYNNLLNDFFFDITDSILANYGKIYRYVGDEVVVSWKLKKGLPEAYFIRSFFDAKRAIHANRERYLQQYGVVPGFTAGFNYGKVIIGEIGEVKSQICFFGDVMYETTEIEKNCKTFKTDVLVSESLLNLVDLPLIFDSSKEGVVKVTGLAAITVFSISEK